MAREIIHAGLTNDRFIERATTGFEEYRASVEPWTLERGERVTGVPAAGHPRAGPRLRARRPRDLAGRSGSPSTHNAVDNVLALINLALLTGHVGRYGSGLNPLRGQNNVQGGGDMGAIPNKLPGFQDVEDDMRPAPASRPRGARRSRPSAAGTSREMFDGHGARRAHDRSTSSARTPRSPRPTPSARSALLEGLDFLVVQDIFLTKTRRDGRRGLPAAASWCESEGGR